MSARLMIGTGSIQLRPDSKTYTMGILLDVVVVQDNYKASFMIRGLGEVTEIYTEEDLQSLLDRSFAGRKVIDLL